LVGLIFLALWPFFAQEPISQTPSLQRLQGLLAQPAPHTVTWQTQVRTLLPRLEHNSSPAVFEAWAALAKDGVDFNRANWVLYCRRHARTLPAAEESLGVEETLERCLALWGLGVLGQTKQALLQAMEEFPEDPRFSWNLNWLLQCTSSTFRPQAPARELALWVLAEDLSPP
jgi:hypothetical protein